MRISRPLESVDAWVRYIGQTELPVLRKTCRALNSLAADQDRVAERDLAAIVLQDPLMTIKVLGYLQTHRRRSQTADITTIGRALLMLGVGPFFRAFAQPPEAEAELRDRPQAMLALLKLVSRAQKAAHYARDWAVLRHDLDVDEITIAALLSDSAEMVLCCFAPDLSSQVVALRAQDRKLRSSEAQRRVFGASCREIQQAVCRAWSLPELLQNLMDEAHGENPRIRNVVLAVRLARHVANGWDDPALPDDYAEIAEFLHLPVETVMVRVGAPEA